MMISFAQNHEDVLLDRLFPRTHKGLYIDVGANDPVHNSMTKHFYDLGWSGINVEPTSAYTALAAGRPRDVNLQLAVSDRDGAAAIHEYPSKTTSSSLVPDPSLKGGVKRRVLTRTLASVCREHIKDRTIDFLSVDVEGHEAAVLRGNDWSRWRPRVVVVEAVHPETRAPEHAAWEPILTDAWYEFAVFDGLNRFYVRREDRNLIPRLQTPVNIFDDFVSRTHGFGRLNEWLGKGPSTEQLRLMGFFDDGHYRMDVRTYLRLNVREFPRLRNALRTVKRLLPRRKAA